MQRSIVETPGDVEPIGTPCSAQVGGWRPARGAQMCSGTSTGVGAALASAVALREEPTVTTSSGLLGGEDSKTSKDGDAASGCRTDCVFALVLG